MLEVLRLLIRGTPFVRSVLRLLIRGVLRLLIRGTPLGFGFELGLLRFFFFAGGGAAVTGNVFMHAFAHLEAASNDALHPPFALSGNFTSMITKYPSSSRSTSYRFNFIDFFSLNFYRTAEKGKMYPNPQNTPKNLLMFRVIILSFFKKISQFLP